MSMKPGRLLRYLFSDRTPKRHRWSPARSLTPNEPLTREHVRWAYRILFDREPESEAVVSRKLKAWTTTRELRADLMSSLEFRRHNPEFAAMNERNIVIKELEGGLRLFIDLSDHVIGLGVLKGTYERGEMDYIRKTVAPGHTVVDIGAHIGFFTIHMASLVGTSGRVYAFEPLGDVADLLERSIAENHFTYRVRVERVAIGRSSGLGQLILATHTLNTGGSYLRGGDPEIPDGHQIADVKVISLDDYPLRRPVNFIKIDVEGAEPHALSGAERTLRVDRPIILSEIHPDQLKSVSGCAPAQFISQVRSYGYDCHLLEGPTLTGKITDVQGPGVRSVVFLPRPG